MSQNNNNNNNNTYHQRQVWRQNKKRNHGPRKKRIKAQGRTRTIAEQQGRANAGGQHSPYDTKA